jgi:hypothetical protein
MRIVTEHEDRILHAMMVLEYQMNQYAIDNFDTGISNEDLTDLAHALLQHGPKGLDSTNTAYLAHLHGVGVEH